MTMNKSGNLSVEYFQAYFKLVMSSLEYDSVEARTYIFSKLFNNDETYRGNISFNSFEQAFESIHCKC